MDVNSVRRAVSERVTFKDVAADGISGPHNIMLPLNQDRAKLAFTLENVFSASECAQLMKEAEAVGFTAAGLGSSGRQSVNTEVRDSGRLISEDPALAQEILKRIRPYLPTVWKGRRLLGLNEQLKFLRYQPGQKFVAHVDGSFNRSDTLNRTFITVQLYLSQGCVEGGATRFVGGAVSPVGGSFPRFQAECNGVRCEPLQGRVLIFQHNIIHEGEEVKSGLKYTIRTDVEYSGESWSGQLQEMLGLGGSPLQQQRRLLVMCAACVTLWVVCRVQANISSG
jgi:hypothetical protein